MDELLLLNIILHVRNHLSVFQYSIRLDYIEALSNYDPTNADIRKYWDQIRKRAGVESAFVATPEIASDPALMHEYIIRERQIELCFEGDRYFTTRRLWKAHTPDKIVTDPVTGEEKDGRIYGETFKIEII